MKNKAKPCPPNEDKYIFTEGIDYSKTGKTSIWGSGDKITLDLLQSAEIQGAWLNLAAGDWGYTKELLAKVDSVVASDIDESALDKLLKTTPKQYRHKLATKIFNMTKKFPFENQRFDGVFCTGTLHLFPKEILQQIFSEMDRVLQPHGKLIIDFSADIKRSLSDGKLITFGKEPMYSLKEAKTTLNELLKNYRTKIYESEVPEYLTKGQPSYKFSSKLILLVADKKVSNS